MTRDPFHDISTALADLGGQRVWSLMVTVFGDLAQDRGSAIDGPVLSAIMAGMNIRPEAVRVALHRLRNDGWIVSAKTGRTSRHSLTALGRAQSEDASARIYAAPDHGSLEWHLAVFEDGFNPSRSEMRSLGFAPLMPRVYIGGKSARAPEGALLLRGAAVPDWLRQQVAPEDLARDYSALHRVLAQADANAIDPVALTPLQIAVLRCLIVHNWRRLVLKHPDLPPGLYPACWDGTRCHALVHRLLSRFPRPRLEEVH